MLATFISLHPFWFGTANVAIIIGFVVIALICAVASPAAIGSSGGPLPFALFAVAFLVLAVYTPYFRTQTREHTKLASVQMTSYYGGKMIEAHVNDHTATMQPLGCSNNFVHEMRRFKVGYRYADDYQVKKGDQFVTEHHPLSRQLVRQLCRAA